METGAPFQFRAQPFDILLVASSDTHILFQCDTKGFATNNSLVDGNESSTAWERVQEGLPNYRLVEISRLCAVLTFHLFENCFRRERFRGDTELQ